MTKYYKLLSILLLLFFSINYSHATWSEQNYKLNLSFNAANLKDVMKEIKIQTKLDFVYNSSEINENAKITVNVKNAPLKDVLNACFKGQNIDYVVQDKIIVLRKKKSEERSVQTVVSQPKYQVIKGRVFQIEYSKDPLPGVTVNIEGTEIYAITDSLGAFTIKNAPIHDNVKLVFSFIGFETQTYHYKGSGEIVITMKSQLSDIGNVIVTGMEVVKKDRMTGSASVITSKDLRMQGITSVDRILDGMVAGLNSTTISGAPGTRSKITIRGENNLSGNSEPLWIIDGLPMMSGVPTITAGDYAGTIMQDGVGNVMPEDIETITILKDASAAAIYGARAANGVIVITTKKGFRSKVVISYSGSYEIGMAPEFNIDFMNSNEKLRYEKSIIDNFGIDFYKNTGRGGYLYKQRYKGQITESSYQNQIKQLNNINTNWFDEIFRASQSHSHSISLRGGSEEMTYYTSVNFQEKNGILSPNKYTSSGILVKLDYRPIKNLILGVNVSANTRKNVNHASVVDPFVYAVFANTYERPYNEDGSYASDLSYLSHNYTNETASGYVFDKFNIMKEMNDTKQTQTGLDADITFNLKYDILKGLSVESIVRKGVSYNTGSTELNEGTYSSRVDETFAKAAFNNPAVLPDEYDNGSFRENAGRNSNWSIRNQIDYSLTLKKDHLFSLLAASEITSKNYNSFGYNSPIYLSEYRITGIPGFAPGLEYDEMRGAIAGMFNTSEGQDRTVSFLGSMRYSYKDKYVVNANIRTDGADVIGDSNRFTPLWSIGLRYNLHNEKFFKNNIISALSIRGSYGYTGNIDRTAYPFSTISFGSDLYQGNRFISEFTYPNPSVTWERKEDKNFGVNMGILNNKINLTVDFYKNTTRDILENLPIPISTGRGQVKANGGMVQNSGMEFYLGVRWVETDNFSFSTSANMSRNKNIILKSQYMYNSISEVIVKGNVRGGVTNVIGQETGSVYGWKFANINPANGNPRYYLTEKGKREFARYVDGWDTYSDSEKAKYAYLIEKRVMPDYLDFTNESKRPAFLNESMQYLGRSNPKFVGGFGTHMRYKSIEFTTQWTFKVGHIIQSFNDLQNAPNNNPNKAQANYGTTSDISVSGTNRERKYLGYWQAAGDVTNIPRFITSGDDYWAGYHTSDKYEKGDYLRMTNLSVSYRLPSKIVKQLKLNNISLGFNARNLLTFTKYSGLDVGTGGAFRYPVSKEFNFKLSIGF